MSPTWLVARVRGHATWRAIVSAPNQAISAVYDAGEARGLGRMCHISPDESVRVPVCVEPVRISDQIARLCM